MGVYERHLEHVAEPADPNDRDDATHVTLLDYEALYLKTKLREYAEYDADGDEKGIALAYVEYINEQVRGRENAAVRLYAHTATAISVLQSAVPDVDQPALPDDRLNDL